MALSSHKDEIAQPVPGKAKESSSLLAMTLEEMRMLQFIFIPA
jgi:hypothetical protein